YNINFSVSDGVNTLYRGVTLFVSAIEITTPGVLPNATQFQPYTATLTATGGSGSYVFTSSSLPPGLTLDASGTISGVVTGAAGATATKIFPLHVSALLETDSPPTGTLNGPYAATLRVIGGTPPYRVAKADGQLPAGVTFDASTLQVSGTPLENGGFRVVWQF